MSRGKWVAGTLVVVVVCAAVALVVFHNDIAIAYHHSAMVRAWGKMREVGPYNDEQSQWIESYEHHRDALVQQGYLARREFALIVKPPETSRVWRQVTAEFPDNIHAIMNTTQWGWTENMIVVWDRPGRMPAWEASIRKYDVPETRTSTPATAGVQDSGPSS